MKLKNLLYICIFAQYTHHIQASDPSSIDNPPKIPSYQDFDYNDSILSAQARPFIPHRHIAQAPKRALFGFIPSDRNLHNKSERNRFNDFIRQHTLKSSSRFGESYDEEIKRLTDYATSQAQTYITRGEIKTLQESVKDSTLHFDFNRIFTPFIKKTNPPKPALSLYVLNGLIHDHQSFLERSENFRFSNKTRRPYGFYSADIHIDPSNPELQYHKDFFPAHWNRSHIASCMLISMNNVQTKPECEDKPDARFYTFHTPLQYRKGKETIPLGLLHLCVTIKVDKKNNKAFVTSAHPELPA